MERGAMWGLAECAWCGGASGGDCIHLAAEGTRTGCARRRVGMEV